MYTLSVKQPAYSILTRTQVFCSWKPGAANTLIGQRIGRFQFTEALQEASHNSVFRGQDIENNIPVIIKLFSPEVSQEQAYAHAFKSGIMDAKSVNDPGFVEIFDSGMTTKEQLYLVMADVLGTSLHDWIYKEGRPPNLSSNYAEALKQQQAVANRQEPTNAVFSLRFAEQLGNQLATLGQLDLIHPHLTPTKILIQADNSLMILGLGVPAQMSAFVSPNQSGFYPLAYTAVNSAPSSQTRMFTLGVILYEMLAGTRPFLKEKRRKHASTTPSSIVPLEQIRLGLTEATYALVAQCLQRSAWNRYETVADLQVAISNALQLETAVAQPYLDQDLTQEIPLVVTAVPEPVKAKPKPQTSPVKPIPKRPAPKPMPKVIAKAAVLPKSDPQPQPIVEVKESSAEKRERSKFLFILPIGIILLFLLVGGVFVGQQNAVSQEGVPVVAVPAAEELVAETAVSQIAVSTANSTPIPPTMQIISPIENGDYLRTDEITFQVRWPQALSNGEQLLIQVQKNSWGNGIVIGAVTLLNGEDDVYELTLPVNDISQFESTYWWQIIRDSDGEGPNLGVPLSQLRPFNILTPIIATTRWTATPIPTSTANITTTPTIIACVRQSDWILYAIQAGDTLSKLAQNSGTTVPQILEANCLTDVPILTINSNILLPRPLNTSTPVVIAPTSTQIPTLTPTSPPSNPNPTNPPAPTQIPPTATIPPVNPSRTPPPAPTAVPTINIPTPTPIRPTNTPIPPAPTETPNP